MNRIQAANELSFRVGFSGHSGHLRVEPLYSQERPNPITSLPDFVLPPAFPRETLVSIKEHIEERYLLPRLDPDEFPPEKAGRQWDFDWFERVRVTLDPSLPRSVVVPTWELPFRQRKNESEGGVWEPESAEVDVSELIVEGQDSVPLLRVAGPAKDVVRGSINNRPFRPGGLDDAQSLDRIIPSGAASGDWVREVLSGGPVQTIPPSLKQGLDLGDLKPYPSTWNAYKDQGSSISTLDENVSNLSVQFDDLFKKAWEDDVSAQYEADGYLSEEDSMKSDTAVSKTDALTNVAEPELSMLDEILAVDSGGLVSLSKTAGGSGEHQQAEEQALGDSAEEIAEHFSELVPDMALKFPFELDTFQKQAIYYLEKGDSVFVAAHTSAGKTVVAEYAFALASKHCTRAVYTAPIKTISNQKYRDFCGKFDVGLLTGDVSLRPEASCLIMTTEILRSMLYRGADIIRDIEWVIFDEVHYVNDVERGVVWEEVIIMLPKHVNIVLLSATVPNTVEFADWISRTKQKKIRVTGYEHHASPVNYDKHQILLESTLQFVLPADVISTTKRPVPLEHCLFYSGELYKICENEAFLPQGLKAAKDAHKKKNTSVVGGNMRSYAGHSAVRAGAHDQKRENPNRGKQNKHSGSPNLGSFSGNQNNGGGDSNWSSRRSEASIWLQLVNKLSKKSLLPVVIFCFSKNRCDKSADNMPGTDLTSSSEKSEIRVFCDKAFSRLKGSDRNLPQIVRVQSLLRRGIGVHHAGLLPIVKEVVEMLFCRGVIKVLFSTETFAMGVNAPARTVVFDTLRKFDGKEFRQLLPGEYTQMAGRAGRRGLDKIGTVVVMCRDEIPKERDLRHVIVGSATRLESQFRLTYIMILHLLRVEELKVEDMLKRSFAEFHTQKNLPEQQQLLLRKLSQPDKTIECIKGEPSIEEYYDMLLEAEKYSNQVSEALMQSSVSHQFLTIGRVVVVKSETQSEHLLGVILKAPSASMKQYIVLVLKPDIPTSIQTPSGEDKKGGDFPSGYVLMPKSKRGLEEEYVTSVSHRKGTGAVNIKLPYSGSAAGVRYEVKGIDSREILSICDCKIKVDQVRLLEEGSSTAFSKTVQLLKEKKPDGNKYPPVLDPQKGMAIWGHPSDDPFFSFLILVDFEGGTRTRDLTPLAFCQSTTGHVKTCCLEIFILGKLYKWQANVVYLSLAALKDLKLKDVNLVEAYRKWTGLVQKMEHNKCHGCIKLEEHIKLAREIKRHKEEVKELKYLMSDEALQQMPEFQGRIDVLKEIGCIDADLVVQIKGRVACEMNSGEELICTECLFENQLDYLEPEEAVAIMSAFVFQQRNTSEPSLTPKLSEARKRLYETAIKLGELQAQFNLQINPQDYASENLKFGLVEVVYEWAKGTPFADICELTDVPEGMIVRTIVRLDETCREFRNAAAIMGNSALYKKMESASNAIKRDIVFAASLYVTGV
ncbi:Antiviral helicase ski2 [Turnera subulata]|uniref:Antiviral helicase ski2 n=1 Tax=Turnera subulata TaxID=218843 RepID=A0A9Q0GHE7_9ROSI|nr:Antiviral helicase ski2 [Turnera subulata]